MESKPLFITLIFLFSLGIILPIVASSFSDNVTTYNHDTFIGSFVNLIDNGFTFGSGGIINSVFSLFTNLLQFVFPNNNFPTSFNPFNLFGTQVNDFIVQQLSIFTYIPNLIAIPIFILMFVAIVFSIWQFIQNLV